MNHQAFSKEMIIKMSIILINFIATFISIN